MTDPVSPGSAAASTDPRAGTHTIGIVGPGRMGVGIATAVLMAARSHPLVLLDVKARPPGTEFAALQRAREEIAANLHLLQELGLVDGDPGQRLETLTLSRDPAEELPPCSLVFETLPETTIAKGAFYAQSGAYLGGDGVIASATSTFTLETLREMGAPPDRTVAAHWLNPAFLIPLVEVAHAEWTDPAAAARVVGFLESIGKIPVQLRSSPGFIVPRIQVAAMNEAVRIVEEGLAGPTEIDTAVKAGFGFRLGVFGLIEFIDLGGIDILAHAGNYLHATLGREHYRPPRSVTDKMAAGEVGPRGGKGYYDYHGVDTSRLFRDRYCGFVELLRAYAESPHLSFRGGIHTGSQEEGKGGPKHAETREER